MDEQVDAGLRNDWACPVVWCTALPNGQTNWSAAAAGAQRLQLTLQLPGSGETVAEPDEEGRSQAQLWSTQPRIWVTERQSGSLQVRAAWLGRMMEQQKTGARMVLVFDFAGGSACRVLIDWAERASRVTDGYVDPSREFRAMLETLKADPQAGWAALCRQEHFKLALIEPPKQEDWLPRPSRTQRIAYLTPDRFPMLGQFGLIAAVARALTEAL